MKFIFINMFANLSLVVASERPQVSSFFAVTLDVFDAKHPVSLICRVASAFEKSLLSNMIPFRATTTLISVQAQVFTH